MRFSTGVIVLFLLASAGCSSDRSEPDAKAPSAKISDEQRVEQLRKQYPFVSLEARLPGRPAKSPGYVQLSDQSKKELQWFDKALDGDSERQSFLRTLHDGTVAEFVNQQGNGWRRMPKKMPRLR